MPPNRQSRDLSQTRETGFHAAGEKTAGEACLAAGQFDADVPDGGADRCGTWPLTFFSAAEGDFSSALALHEFRIATKQLRYAMEVFADAFARLSAKNCIRWWKSCRKSSGPINDHANARDRYLTWLDDTQIESQRLLLGTLIAEETAGLQHATRSFRDWWTPVRAAELKARFWQEILPSELRGALRSSYYRAAMVREALRRHRCKNRPPLSYQPVHLNLHQVMSTSRPNQRPLPASNETIIRRSGNGCG